MAHCPNCGKEVSKPSRQITNFMFTIQEYNCKGCHNHFKVVINQSMYMQQEIGLTETAIF